jgi:hypothetical protein
LKLASAAAATARASAASSTTAQHQTRPRSNVALPSVAPDMRILSYEVKPKIALKFSKDGADNFYVKSDESSASGG